MFVYNCIVLFVVYLSFKSSHDNGILFIFFILLNLFVIQLICCNRRSRGTSEDKPAACQSRIPDPGFPRVASRRLPLHKLPRVRGVSARLQPQGVSHREGQATGTSHCGRALPSFPRNAHHQLSLTSYLCFLPPCLFFLFLPRCRRGSRMRGRMKALRKLHSRDRRESSRISSQSRLP
jgi:hypothetical protein